MQTLTTTDGTTIAYQATGAGPALVLVVGAFCDRSTTEGLAALLADSFTVYEYDRRGRGDSGDTAPYDVQREVEDLAAVVAATGETPYVYGHSSGAVIALEAAASGVPMRALVAYEPPYTAEDDGSGGSAELCARVRELVAAGDLDGAGAAFLTATGMSADVVAMVQRGPYWPRMRSLAPALVYDLTVCNGGVLPVQRLSRIGVPTLVLSGGASPPWAGRAAAAVAAAVPGARRSVIPDQDHALAHEAIAPVLRELLAA